MNEANLETWLFRLKNSILVETYIQNGFLALLYLIPKEDIGSFWSHNQVCYFFCSRKCMYAFFHVLHKMTYAYVVGYLYSISN